LRSSEASAGAGGDREGRRVTEDSRKGSREGIEGMGCGESAIKVKKRKGKKDGREKMKIEKEINKWK
jgi:hypothetical protein